MPMLRRCGGTAMKSRPSTVIVAGRRLLEAGDDAQRRRLAAARGAEHREELAAAHVEADVVDRGDRRRADREFLGQVAHAERRVGHRAFRAWARDGAASGRGCATTAAPAARSDAAGEAATCWRTPCRSARGWPCASSPRPCCRRRTSSASSRPAGPAGGATSLRALRRLSMSTIIWCACFELTKSRNFLALAGFGPPLTMPLASLMSAVPSFG